MEDGGTDDVVSAPDGECLLENELLAHLKRMDDLRPKFDQGNANHAMAAVC